MREIKVGLIGAGTVGGGVLKILSEKATHFADDLGLPIRVARIADKDTNRLNTLPTGDAICSTNADDIISDDGIETVIELVGGTGFARNLVLRALHAGKHVVTANKALLAEYGPEIFEAAEKNNVSVYFEAAVGGGMPTIKTIRESMVANDIYSLKTIINGTCNYILTEMEARGLSFDDALGKAQDGGFAEADPTLDVGGGDSGHKIAIMASLLRGGFVPYEDVPIEGIIKITEQDISFARDLGYRIKLLGIIKSDSSGLEVRVHPAMLHTDHILASVSKEYNAVLLEGDAVGQILLYGKGAGELPTASAVVGDIIDVARNLSGSSPKRIPMNFYAGDKRITLRPSGAGISRYYLRFTVADRPGVLALIASALGEKNISIASVVQKEGHSSEYCPVVILTHPAEEKNLRDAVGVIEKMDYIRHETQIIRIEE